MSVMTVGRDNIEVRGDWVRRDKIDGSTITNVAVNIVGPGVATALPIAAAAGLGFLAPALLAKLQGNIRFERDADALARLRQLAGYSWDHKGQSAATGLAFSAIAWYLTR